MDITVVVVIFLAFVFAWLQLSAYSFLFNICVSIVVILLALYFIVSSSVFLPLEQIIFFLFYKDRSRRVPSSDVSTTKVDYDNELSRKFRELTGHIVRDFILDWYNTVSDDVHFVQEAFELFEHLFHCLRTRVSAVDSEVLLKNLLCFLSRHLTCYQQSVQYATKMSPSNSERRRQLIIITYEKRLGHLAMSNYPDTETDHLRSLTTVLLKALLPRDYRLTGASLYVVRELISKNVFLPFIDILTNPHWINCNIVLILKSKSPNDEEQITDSSEEGSETSSDWEEVDVGKDLKIEKKPPAVIIPQEDVSSSPVPRKARKDMKVAFSVSANADELELDVDYVDPGYNSTLSEHFLGFFPESTKNIASETHRECTNDEQAAHSRTFLSESMDSSSNASDVAMMRSISENSAAASDEQIDPTENSNPPEIECNVGLDSADDPVSDLEKRLNLHDDRFFKRIRIPQAMTIEEAFVGGSKYTLYVIEYCAPPSLSSITSLQKQDNPSNEEAEEKRFDDVSSTADNLQHYQVKRRFREFLNLQDRLNEKPVLRRLTRNVRAPSRMFPMPIGNMDKDYIEKRRKFLQAYLRELCNFPHVNKSTEMKEFLSYNADPRIAFVRRPSHYIPRFDKIFKNVVQDLFGAASDKIADKFAPKQEQNLVEPSFDVEEPFQEQVKPPPISLAQASASSTSLNEFLQVPGYLTPRSKKNPVAKLKNIMLGRTTDLAIFEEGLRDFSPFTGPANSNQMRFGRRWRTPDNLLSNRTSYHATVMRRRSQGDGCDQLYDLEGQAVTRKDMITGPIFRLVNQLWGVCLGTNTLLFSSLGGFVKKYVDLRVSLLTSKDQWLFYLKTLQQALWPGGIWSGRKEEEAEVNKEQLYAEAQLVLEKTFPNVLRYMIGKQRYSRGVADLLDSLQDPVINRHVAYHLVDILIKLIIPDLPTVVSQATNISL